jgi:hypothetical protein
MDLALRIAMLDAGRPKQANLRRAVSTAYYAVFHFLADEVCCAQIGTQNSQRPFRHALSRAFVHTTMKSACSSFGGGTLKSSVTKGLPQDPQGTYRIPKPIQDIAATFAELQEKRHLADYDLSERFKRSEVLTLIDQAKIHVRKFCEYQVCDDRKFFLACLWAWKELTNR